MAHAILIVDDDPGVRDALRRVFRGGAWDVATAADAASCIAEYERHPPDVVLLDHGLPGLSGLQLLAVLRQRDPDATVLMLTGRAEIPIAVEAMRRAGIVAGFAVEDSSNGVRAAAGAGLRVLAVPDPAYPLAPDAAELADSVHGSLEEAGSRLRELLDDAEVHS